ncbi:hypothetical protein AVDCRST_MAG81-2402 [uncultured Synechococcales cyanobacterium]|uniref:Uncharacterized protein n=2 Tax=Cyanophyceae TaxID=3028117 RepID=A0A6J4VEC4_9CYAN|nr:hypothetical protein AVDCRST_MAG81-2402 [uncultured Synechococcales cyanobacterium]
MYEATQQLQGIEREQASPYSMSLSLFGPKSLRSTEPINQSLQM